MEIFNQAGEVIISGDYESIKDCCEKNMFILNNADLSYANLGNADLSYADLRNANLRNANLRGANLKGIKNYSDCHDIFFELLRRQKPSFLTKKEKAFVYDIMINRYCWNRIVQFGESFLHLLEKVSKLGFDEYEIKYRETLMEY